ncbi:MAG: hypothetical protein ABH844_00100 [Candidatus Omnitrophota bacterium]
MFNILKNKNTNDQIDFELSRTYFRNFSKESDFQNTESNIPSTKINRVKQVFFGAAIFAVTAVIVFFGVHFLKSKSVIFEVKLNVADNATETPEASVLSPAPVMPEIVEKQKKEEPQVVFTNGRFLSGFEKTLEGWELPEWTLQKNSYSASSIARSTAFASKGNASVALSLNFPGTEWTRALIENEEYFNFKDFDVILVDIYLPKTAPHRLRGSFVFTTGDSWTFMEMARGRRLKPGQWTTIAANISAGSTDWKSAHIDEAFRQDIHKIALKIESVNVPYSGSVYIDNIRVATIQK